MPNPEFEQPWPKQPTSAQAEGQRLSDRRQTQGGILRKGNNRLAYLNRICTSAQMFQYQPQNCRGSIRTGRNRAIGCCPANCFESQNPQQEGSSGPSFWLHLQATVVCIVVHAQVNWRPHGKLKSPRFPAKIVGRVSGKKNVTADEPHSKN